MSFDYADRLERLQAAMEAESVDALILPSGPDLRYFTGYEGRPSERLTVLIVQASRHPTLLVPELEAPGVEARHIAVRPWSETDDPVAMATSSNMPRRVAVGDQMWSVFLMRFQDRWDGAEWLPASRLTAPLRITKDDEEVKRLQSAGSAVDRVMLQITDTIGFAGRTEREVARELRDLIVEEGHETAEFTIVASGPNSASPHHEPGVRIFQEGDVVVCDFGGRWDGYFSDSTRTFVVGEPSRRAVEVHQVVLAANEAARASVGPGVPAGEIDRVARSVIEDSGLGEWFIHRTGHGIGLEVHEPPYLVRGSEVALEPGMAFSIEPGVYMPGEFGVRIEDIVVCSDGGSRVLNHADRSLRSVH